VLSSLIHVSLFVKCPLFHIGVCWGLCWVICFDIISCSLFLVSWNFLSVSCTFWLTISYIFTMNFSEISSLRAFSRHHWVSYLHLLFCWGQELDIHFLHFPLNPILNYFFEDSHFHPFFLPLLHLVLCHYIFGKLVCGFDCLISFPDLIFVLWLTWLFARLICPIWPSFVSSGISHRQLWSQMAGRSGSFFFFNVVQSREAFHGLGVQDVIGFDSDWHSFVCWLGEERKKKEKKCPRACFPGPESGHPLLGMHSGIFTAVRCN
jgi:hypothetical protein